MYTVQRITLALLLMSIVGGTQVDASQKRPKQPVELEREFNALLPAIARGDYDNLDEANKLIKQIRGRKDNTRANRLQKELDFATKAGEGYSRKSAMASRFEEQADEFEEQAQNTLRELKGTAAELKRAQGDIAGYRVQLNSQEQNIKNLESEIAGLRKAGADSVNATQARIKQLEREISDKNKQWQERVANAELEADLETKGYTTQIANFNKQIKGLEGELKKAKEECDWQEKDALGQEKKYQDTIKKLNADLKRCSDSCGQEQAYAAKATEGIRSLVESTIRDLPALIDSAARNVRKNASQYFGTSAAGVEKEQFEAYIKTIKEEASIAGKQGFKSICSLNEKITNHTTDLGRNLAGVFQSYIYPQIQVFTIRLNMLDILVTNTIGCS